MRRTTSILLYLLVVATLSPLPTLAQDISTKAPVNVTVMPFSELAYHPESSAPASVVSLNDAVLSAQIQTSVLAIPVKVAERVNMGHALVELDCRNAKAMLKANAAKAEFALFQLQRAKKLHKGNNISEELLRQRQSEAAAAESALAISRVDVERCTITAPFNGTVQERLIDVGEWVSPGTPLIRVVDLDDIEVTAEISAFNSAGLANAASYEFLLGEQRHPLTMRAISAVTDADGRTRTIRLIFSATAGRARPAPGESGRLLWREPVRYLPSDYLEKRNGKNGVMIVEDSKVKFVVVALAQEGRPVPITLNDDVLMIDRGRQTVSDGDSIRIVQ